MYTSPEDVKEIFVLMQDIREGKISRNKNYYTLAKSKEYNRFKRAKLLISLIEDLEKVAIVSGGKVDLGKNEDLVEVSLYNPSLKYTRKVCLTEAELDLIKSQTTAIHY